MHVPKQGEVVVVTWDDGRESVEVAQQADLTGVWIFDYADKVAKHIVFTQVSSLKSRT
jgi:hypothetical protein